MSNRPTFRLLEVVECRSYKIEGKWIKGIVVYRTFVKKVWKYGIYTGKNGIINTIEREQQDIREITKTTNYKFWK